MSKGNSRASVNNRSNQMNSNNGAYHSSRSGGSAGKAARDNHSNQFNPNNSAFHSSRKAPADSGGGFFSKSVNNLQSENKVKAYDQGFVQKHKKSILISAGVGVLGLLLTGKKK